jgi:hypothetical protein
MSKIEAYSAKTTPASADLLVLADSADLDGGGDMTTKKVTVGSIRPPQFGPLTQTATYTMMPNVVQLGTAGTVTLASNLVRYFPFIVCPPVTIATLQCEVSTNVAATNVAWAIYECDVNYTPGALVADLGTISSATTGAKSIGSLSQSLGIGRYLLALNSNGAPALRTWRGSWQNAPVLGTFASTMFPVFFRTGAQAYGSWPGTGPAITTVGTGNTGFDFPAAFTLSAYG